MHRHWNLNDWLRALGDPRRGNAVARHCSEAQLLWPDLSAWADHASACAECRRAAAKAALVAPEVLDCPACREALEYLWALLDDLEHFEPAVALEYSRADRLLDQLSDRSPEQQALEVARRAKFQQWGFCQWLLGASRAEWQNDAAQARHLATLAVAVANHLDPGYYHPGWLANLRAKARAYLGNAHRLLGEFGPASRHIAEAEAHLRRGVGLRTEPQVLLLKASLTTDDRGQPHKTLPLLDRIEAAHAAAGDTHQMGRIRMKRSGVLPRTGQPLQAVRESRRAIQLLDPARDAALIVMAEQNRASVLAKVGQGEQARQIFESLPPAEGGNFLARRHWVDAMIHRVERKPRSARQAYGRALEILMAFGRRADALAVRKEMAQAEQPVIAPL